MKKHGFLALALVLWLLLFNTFFAFRVEELMTPWVTTTMPQYGVNSVGTVVPLDCQFWDEAGAPVLYQVYDGTAWENGDCVRTLASEQYEVKEKDISVEGMVTLVRYATKPPRAGEPVNIMEKRERREDAWLAVCQEKALPMRELGKNMAVEAQCDSGMLVSVADAEQPFLEKSAMSQIFAPDIFSVEKTIGGGPQVSVYSLSEIKQFFGQLPVLAGLVTMVFAFLALWVNACMLAKDVKRNKKRLAIHGLFALILTAAVPVAIHCLDLPSSLLPQNNIVDFAFYANEHAQIFGALRALAAQGSQLAQEAIAHSEQMLMLSAGIVLAGMVLVMGGIALEKGFLRKREKRQA